jgi:hypothetical protein
MTVEQLIQKLKMLPPDLQVMSRDVVAYRDVCGPYETEICEQDADDHADCEGRINERIVAL